MAKILYAGTASDFVVTTVTVPASAGGTVDVLKLNPGASLEAWGAGTGGSQITDIALFTGSYTTAGGAAPSGIFPAESSSTFLFWAEDTLDAVYVTGQGQGVLGGQRWLARPVNDVARLRVIEALNPIGSAEKAAALGVASLDATGKVPTAQLPASGVSGVIDITTPNGGTDSGNVTLTTADMGAVPTTRLVSAGTGLNGGGDLSANRTLAVTFGTTAGTVAEGNDSRFGAASTAPRPVFAQVLSKDAPTEWITAAAADPYTWVCDATNDEVQIQAAIDAACPRQGASAPFNAGSPASARSIGMVQLSGGRFNIGAAGIQIGTAVHLNGAGQGSTELRAVSCNQTGLIRLRANTDHLTHVSNFYMQGNSGSGGTCSGIHYDMTGGANTSAYPDSNPDSDHLIENLYIFGFDANTSRHGIHLQAGSGDHNRGNMVRNIQMRSNYANAGGNGIYFNGSSDCFITDCHIGGYTIAYRIAGGNTKMNGNKSFYSNQYGVYITSGRALISGHESQDDDTGIFLDGVPATATGLVIDTCNAAGLRISNDRIQAVAFNIFVRSGGRYATQTRGIYYDGTFTNCSIIGNVENANITTAVSGTVPTGTNLVTVS